MAYSGLINRNLVLAFKLLKDLAKPATFTFKQDIDFDFDELEVKTDGENKRYTLVVELQETKKNADKKLTTKQILFMARDIGPLDQLATVTIEGEDWSVDRQLNSRGPVAYLSIIKA